MDDGAVSFSYFYRALRSMNRNLVIKVDETTVTHGTMVYLDINHPDCDPVTGLWELIAVPSPLFYPKMPKHDTEFVDAKGSYKWVRGWSTFFKAVCKMRDPNGKKILSADKVRAWFDRPFDKFNSREYQAQVRYKREQGLRLARQMADKRYVFDWREMPSHMGA